MVQQLGDAGPAATEELIVSYNPAWTMAGGTGLYPRWLTDLATAGFVGIETFSFDSAVPYTSRAWIGRVRASAGIGASLPDDKIAEFSQDLARLIDGRFPGQVHQLLHRTWAVVARPAPGRRAPAREPR